MPHTANILQERPQARHDRQAPSLSSGDYSLTQPSLSIQILSSSPTIHTYRGPRLLCSNMIVGLLRSYLRNMMLSVTSPAGPPVQGGSPDTASPTYRHGAQPARQSP